MAKLSEIMDKASQALDHRGRRFEFRLISRGDRDAPKPIRFVYDRKKALKSLAGNRSR